MSLSTRYLLRRLLFPFLLALAILTSVLLLIELFELTELVVNKGIPVRGILLILLTKIPETFTVTVPMSLVMAVFLTFGRMAHDNELMVLRLAGYPLHRMLLPPLTVGLVLALTLVGLHEYGMPQLSRYQQKTLSELQLINPVALMQPRTYLEIPPYTIYAVEINGGRMKNVWIEDRRSLNPQIIISQRAKWVKRSRGQYNLVLRNGTLHQKGQDEGYRVLKFDRQVLQFSPSMDAGSLGIDEPIKSLSERYASYRKLARRIQGNDDKNNNRSKLLKKYRKQGTKLHRTLALPFAAVFLVLTTAPTGLFTQRYGMVVNFIFCLGIFFLYYVIFTLAEPLAQLGYLPPFLAMWGPNMIFGGAGLVLFWYLKRHDT